MTEAECFKAMYEALQQQKDKMPDGIEKTMLIILLEEAAKYIN